MLAIRETISYTKPWTIVITILVAFFSAALIFLLSRIPNRRRRATNNSPTPLHSITHNMTWTIPPTPTPPNPDEQWVGRVWHPTISHQPTPAPTRGWPLFGSPPQTSTSQVGRTSWGMPPQGPVGYRDPPSPPRSNNLFRSGWYGLQTEDLPSLNSNGATRTSAQRTMPPLPHGSSRPSLPYYESGTSPYTTAIGLQMMTQSGNQTRFPPTGYKWPRNYPSHDQGTLNLEVLYHSHPSMSPTQYPSPQHHDDETHGQNQTLTQPWRLGVWHPSTTTPRPFCWPSRCMTRQRPPQPPWAWLWVAQTYQPGPGDPWPP